MTDMPTGTVTLLFTDIEGSTRLLEQLGRERYAEALSRHRAILREAFSERRGYEVDYEGDAFFVSFASAADAIEAAAAGQRALAAEDWPDGYALRVRMGLHTGEPLAVPPKYVGLDVHRAARIASAAHGGQVVLSQQTRAFVEDAFLLTDLGEHRLKDFEEPVWIYQLGEERFPPLKTVSNTNLPRPASSFVGREREVAEVISLLQDSARLVTLTGPGGSGKTRLAIEAAAELVPAFPNGVYWVGLAALNDAALVPETITQTLGAKEGLADHIGERALLILLDNFEQVMEAAPQLSALLRACANLRLLVTSRELLRIEGEIEYAVPPLADAEALELFCARARIEPDEAVAELTQRLDNLPLAIELAAARTSLLTPEQILERLSERLDLLKGGRDADPRQKTLRATIGWSYDLLEPSERALLRRLSVFVGGWTLRAAEEIAGGDLDTLASLLDKSLIRRSDRRYWMLETIREFAAEELDGSPEQAAVHDRHMRWYASELSQRELAVRDHDVDAVGFVEAELENARAALTHALGHQEPVTAVLLLWGTYTTWLLSGRAVEGARCAEMALAADLPVAGVERVCLLGATGELLRHTGDLERAQQLKEAALAAARSLVGETLPGGRTMEAIVISGQCDLADLALTRGDITAARNYSGAALIAARAGADLRALSRALGSGMWTAFESGDPCQAIALAAECLALDTRAGRAVDVADDLILTSLSRLRLGEVGGAGADLADALGNIRAHPGRSLVLVNLLIAAGQLALALGRRANAAAFARLAVKTVGDQGAVLTPALAELLREIQKGHTEVPEVEGDVALLTEDEALDLAATIAASAGEYKPADALASG